MYRVSASAVDHVDNGTDGTLFRQNPKWAAFALDSSATNKVDWKQVLLWNIPFSDSVLSADDQRILAALCVLTLFFPERFPTRPILTLIGEKGSGKTTLLRQVGQVLLGSKFDVTALTKKSDDFDAAITNDPLVLADNADDAPEWFPDRLAVVATGGTI